MRLEFEPNASAIPFVEKDVVNRDAASETEKMLREGIKAAQDGNRAEARNLLLRVTETETDNETAWLWLASISEYPEELLVFLNNVLRINPQNERALEWHKATKSLLAKTLLQRGVEAVNENRRDFARQCFEQALEHEAENEMAWLWMASVSDSDDEKAAYFEKVLSVNPDNQAAAGSLRSIQSQKTQKMFQDALESAFDGRQAEAKETLETVLSRDAECEDAWVLKSHLAESFEERAECFLKLSALNPENEMAKANLASWRMLSEKRVAQPIAEEKAEVSAEVFNEEPAAEFSDYSSNGLYVESESAPAEASDEPEAETQVLEFGAPEAESFDEPQADAQETAAQETAESVYSEQFAEPDHPTGESSFDAVQEEEPAQNQFVAEQSKVDAQEARAESEDSEVLFETDEATETAHEFSAAPGDLAAQLEAEEAEMNWAFSNSQPAEAAEDYFRNFDEEDDIHKTQQANYEAEDFSLDVDAEQPAEEFVAEPVVEPAVEQTVVEKAEWRDNSPNVFLNYSPSAFETASEAPTVEFSVAETAVAEVEAAVFPVPFEEFAATENQAEFFLPEESVEAVEEDSSMQFDEVLELKADEVFEIEVEEPVEMKIEEVAESRTEEKLPQPKAETVLCPFCNTANDKQAFSCSSCQTVLTLSDLEMLLASQAADQEKLRQAVESLERENESYGLSAEQLTNLGVGHVNLKNYRQGFFFLQEAVRMNPSNVLLDAQVNALAIRLSEMEEQQTVHDSMPKNRKILVVDDSPTVRKLISGKLEKCGHEVVCAIDGVDALEKINELMPDLVLLDITMPRMDGYQVCKLIRSNDATKDVPVVMISGKDGFFDKVRGRMAGTTGYITKPFGPETLMKTVETYLN
jgi:twitching motility two-component system response regulator PilG